MRPMQPSEGFRAVPTIDEVLRELLEDEMRQERCGGSGSCGCGTDGGLPRLSPQYATMDDLREADLFVGLVQRSPGPVIVADRCERDRAALVALSPRAFENLLFDHLATAVFVARSGLRAPQGAW